MTLHMDDPIPSLDGATDWFNSTPINRDDLIGNPVLIHFWAVSCGTCKESLPDIAKWIEAYSSKGLKVIAIHMPRMESDTNLDSIKETIAEYEIKQPCAVDNLHAIKEAFDNKYVPAFYVFDSEGKMRDYKAGEKAPKMVEQAIQRVLSQPVAEEAK